MLFRSNRRRWDLNPRSAINALRDFESRLFDLLSTSPYMSTRMIRENKLFSCSGKMTENCRPTVGLRAGPIPREPVRRKDFREAARDGWTRISSQSRYDHFDTSPCMFTWFSAPKAPFQRKNFRVELQGRTARYSIIWTHENRYTARVLSGWNDQMAAGFRVSPVMTSSIPLRIMKMNVQQIRELILLNSCFDIISQQNFFVNRQ